MLTVAPPRWWPETELRVPAPAWWSRLADRSSRGAIGREGLAEGLDPAVFRAAWARVRRHPSPGIDGVGRDRFEAHLEANLRSLRAMLLSGRYHPSPLVHFHLSKPNGGSRLLSLPTLSDRVVQTAVHLVASPRLDFVLAPEVHGYRPGRSPTTAVRHLRRTIARRPWLELVQVDVESMFDRLEHSRLYEAVRGAWPDPLWARLQRTWMAAWHFPGTPGRGVPQGAPLSPLVANLYLGRWVDRAIAQGGPAIRNAGLVAWIRYGDDLVLASERRGGSAMLAAWIDGLLGACGLRAAPAKVRFACGPDPAMVPVVVLGIPLALARDQGGWSLGERPTSTRW